MVTLGDGQVVVVSPTTKVITVPAAGAAGIVVSGGGLAALAARVTDLEDADESQAVAVSTDASFGLPAPTGTGLELVITGDALDDIRWNGASL